MAFYKEQGLDYIKTTLFFLDVLNHFVLKIINFQLQIKETLMYPKLFIIGRFSY